MNIFDAIGKTVFDVCRVTFGYTATWLKIDGPPVVADVLYKYPTKKAELGENDYSLEVFQMEYYETDFPGLLESVSDAETERIKIEVSKGVFLDFVVTRTPERKGDGKTIIATLTPVNL